MSQVYLKLKDCYQNVLRKTSFKPDVGLVLGSGLGGFADSIKIDCVVRFDEIGEFPVSTVSGHEGKFIFGQVGNVNVVAMQGRVHYYEGYEMSDVVLPIRLMGMLNAKAIVLTNAAGGLNENYCVGDLVLINDHISSFVPSPLRGENLDQLGTRFPDMTSVYDEEMREKAVLIASQLGIDLKQGVYTQLSGPAYETPAEIRMLKALGTDIVGMSTACEAMAAYHMGIRVCGISCVTNMASGINNSKLSHDEVKGTANRIADKFENLICSLICEIGDDL